MESKNAVKERVFIQLNECLNKLTKFDVQSIMPLFYVLVAHHEGHLLSIIGKGGNIFARTNRYIQSVEDCDGYESELLKSIRNCVDSKWFEGESADIVFRFYDYCNEYIKEYYLDIINYVIDYFAHRAGKYSGVVATPNELGSLMAKLVKGLRVKSVFDPCAGLCTYAIQPEMENVPFTGWEFSGITKVIAQIRLDAAKKEADYQLGDCTDPEEWNEVDADCLVCEPPFGVRLSVDDPDTMISPIHHGMAATMEDFLVAQFLDNESLQTAVLLLSAGRMFDRNNHAFRKELVERNLIQTIIALPGGILPYTAISTYIVVLNKKKDYEYVTFIQAEDCTVSGSRGRVLDVDEILNRLNVCLPHMACREDFAKQDYILTIDRYVSDIKTLPGQHIVYIEDVADIIKPSSRFNETSGAILRPENMSTDIAEMSSSDISLEVAEVSKKNSLRKIEQPCVIFDTRANKFFVKHDSSPLFISASYTCVVPCADKCLPEYFAYVVATAKKVEKGMAIQRADLAATRIAIYDNLESQRNIINRIYRESQIELKKKLDKLQLLNSDASDLVHNLGLTFTKIGAAVQQLQSDSPNEIVSNLSDNIQYALRQIRSTGADYSMIRAHLKKVNLQNVMEEYLRGWDNYGYKTFEVALSISQDLPANTKIEVDKDLLFTALDCVFTNAHQHGFNKRLQNNNSVVVNLTVASYEGEDYAVISISNNGNPLPEQFGLTDFVKRGTVGLNSSQDGLGGHHIHEITKKFNGKVSLESDSEWVTVSLLIPFYTSDDNFKANDYEYECV